MEPADLIKVLVHAAAYLYEGNEIAALDLLLLSDPEFVPQHDFTTNTGWNGSEPDTFVLWGPRRLVEAFRAESEPAKQIKAAFQEVHPEQLEVRARYRPTSPSPPDWKEVLAKELPYVGSVDAEFRTDGGE